MAPRGHGTQEHGTEEHRTEDVVTLTQDPAPPAEAPEKPPVEDPLRRLALIVTAVAVPVVIALVVLVNVLGSGGQEQRSGSGRPAEVHGAPPQRADLPVSRSRSHR